MIFLIAVEMYEELSQQEASPYHSYSPYFDWSTQVRGPRNFLGRNGINSTLYLIQYTFWGYLAKFLGSSYVVSYAK